jgi:hypothetical protein
MPFQQDWTGTGEFVISARRDFKERKYGQVSVIGFTPEESRSAKVS